MSNFERRANIIGPVDVLDTLSKNAFKIRSFDNVAFATKRCKDLFAHLSTLGAQSESVFDAAHGRRYMLFIYRSAEERRACWDVLTRAA